VKIDFGPLCGFAREEKKGKRETQPKKSGEVKLGGEVTRMSAPGFAHADAVRGTSRLRGGVKVISYQGSQRQQSLRKVGGGMGEGESAENLRKFAASVKEGR